MSINCKEIREIPFKFRRLGIPEVILIEPTVFADKRGFFMEAYKQKDFLEFGIPQVFVQDNHSKSIKGVLRGLHYQKEPMSQGKLVRCIRGAIFDVAVDIRKNSPTYGKWVTVTLSEENKLMFWIPRGFAHGILALEEGTEILYKVDNFYSQEHERGIKWNDPDIGINWPMKNPILSEKDASLPTLKEADNDFIYGGNL